MVSLLYVPHIYLPSILYHPKADRSLLFMIVLQLDQCQGDLSSASSEWFGITNRFLKKLCLKNMMFSTERYTVTNTDKR